MRRRDRRTGRPLVEKEVSQRQTRFVLDVTDVVHTKEEEAL
jgi:hypothetical protein